jgi:hypothetical protein
MRPFIVTLAFLLLLAGCKEDPPAAKPSKAVEAARIEREVAKRVEAARLESTVRTNRLRTIRIIGFCFLAGFAVAGLIWVQQPRFPNPQGRLAPPVVTRPPQWVDHSRSPTGRVIDLHTNPATTPVPPRPRTQSPVPGRRRQPHQAPHPRHHEAPRNHRSPSRPGSHRPHP